MATLPQIQIDDQATMLMQSRWKSLLDPVLRSQILDGNLIQNVQINSGTNYINHGLARNQVGWFIVDQTGPTNLSRPASSPFNDKTLTLVSSVSVTVALWCF